MLSGRFIWLWEKKKCIAFCVFPIRLTLEGESVFLESKKALLLSGSRIKSATDKSMIREWSF